MYTSTIHYPWICFHRANGSPIHKVAAEAALFDSSDEEEGGDEKREDSNVPDDTRDVQMDFFNRIDRQLRERKSNLDKIEVTSRY